MSNQTLQPYSGFHYEEYIKKLKTKNRTIPPLIRNSLAETIEIENPNEKLKYFLLKVQTRKVGVATAIKYTSLFQKLLNLKDSNIKVNKLGFDPTPSRYVPMNELQALFDHFVETQNLLMMFCFITGLRSMEVAQFASNHLDDLTKRVDTTNIILKGGKKQWKILWSSDLISLTQLLTVKFEKELKYYRETGAAIKLWNVTPITISERFKKAYSDFFGKIPPKGFGLHNIRYYWATKYSSNLVLAKLKLNHSKLHTTESYVKLNAEEINFDGLNKTLFYQAIFKK